MSPRGRGVVALAGVVALSCGAAIEVPPFRILFPDNRLTSIEGVLSRIGRPEAARPVNAPGAALLVIANANRVVAHDVVSDRRLWQAELPVGSAPIVTRKAVFVLSGEDVVALSLDGGRLLWRFPREESFLGATASSDVAYLVFGTAVSAVARITERRAGALVAVDLETGDELYRIETERQFGAPSVAGEIVVLPWERQYISFFSGRTGTEMARLRTRDDVISFVESRPEGVFYGGRGLYRLTARSVAGTKTGQTRRALPESLELPGEPSWGRDGYVPAVDDAAREGIRVYWAPGVSDIGELPIAGEMVYYLYYRYLFGISATDGAVKWGTRLSADVVAASATAGGLALLDQEGILQFVRAEDGAVDHRSAVVSPPLFSGAFDLGGARPPANVESAPRSVRVRLLEIALDRDNRLVPARAFAARALGLDPDPLVTADLVQIIGRRDVPQVVRDAAARGLEGRRHGTEPLLAALEPQYDYLRRTEPGPVGALAAAVSSMHERRAVPALLRHLDDPHSSPETLAAVAKALGELGDRAALEPLFAFLQRYHADPSLGYRPPALAEAIRAIGRLGARPAHARLEEIGADPSALAFVRDAVRETLATPDEPEAETPAAPTPPAVPAPAAEPTPPPAVAEPMVPFLPRSLSMELVNATIEAQVPAMRRCISPAEESTLPPRLRLIFGIVGATGRVDHPSVGGVPAGSPIASCILTALSGVEFQRFVELRQRVTYVLDVQPPAPERRRPGKRPPTKRPAKAPTAPTKAPPRTGG